MANKALKARYSSCASVHTLQRQGALPAHTACMTVTGAKVYDFLTPMHVWELDTPFGRITRRLYYGTEEILKPKPSFDELVPNIGTTFVGILFVKILPKSVSKIIFFEFCFTTTLFSAVLSGLSIYFTVITDKSILVISLPKICVLSMAVTFAH